MKPHLPIPEDVLAQFCERHHIRRLSLFGSMLKGTQGPDLDQLASALTLSVVVQQVTNGGASMPAFKGTLTAAQIEARSPWARSPWACVPVVGCSAGARVLGLVVVSGRPGSGPVKAVRRLAAVVVSCSSGRSVASVSSRR